MDDKKTNELMVKCEAMKDDPTLMKECKVMLDTMVEKKVEMEDEPWTDLYQYGGKHFCC